MDQTVRGSRGPHQEGEEGPGEGNCAHEEKDTVGPVGSVHRADQDGTDQEPEVLEGPEHPHRGSLQPERHGVESQR